MFDTQSWSKCSPVGRASQNGANLFNVSIQCTKKLVNSCLDNVVLLVSLTLGVWLAAASPTHHAVYIPQVSLGLHGWSSPQWWWLFFGWFVCPCTGSPGQKTKSHCSQKGKEPLGAQSESNANSMPSRAGAPSTSSTTVATSSTELPPPDDDGEIDFIRSGTLSRPHVLPKAKISPKSQARRTKGGPKGSRTNVGRNSKEPRKTNGVPDLFDCTSDTLKGAAEEIPSVIAMPFSDMVDVMFNAPWSRSWWNERCTSWEIYNVPRLGPHVRKLGGTCRRSYDIQHFWDLGLESYQRTLLQDLATFRPFYLSLSPPCTYLCKLMASNWSRMRGNKKFLCLRDGLGHVDLCAWIALFQLRTGAFFGMEHPAGSLAWNRDSAAQFERKYLVPMFPPWPVLCGKK